MIFPLKKRTLIRGAAAHIRAGLGAGADYVASTGTNLYASSDGVIERTYYGTEGGNWLWLKVGDKSVQFAHLSDYRVNQGQSVKEGQLIALTGNTGKITTGPHLHVQIIQGSKRLDPEAYFNIAEVFMTEDQVKELTWRILHHTWRTHNGHGMPDDSSIRREVDEYLGKYKQNHWAFSDLIERWWKEGTRTDDTAKLLKAKELAASIQQL